MKELIVAASQSNDGSYAVGAALTVIALIVFLALVLLATSSSIRTKVFRAANKVNSTASKPRGRKPKSKFGKWMIG